MLSYVGSHCVVQLLKEDFNVICIDNFVNCQRGELFPCEIHINKPEFLLQATNIPSPYLEYKI